MKIYATPLLIAGIAGALLGCDKGTATSSTQTTASSSNVNNTGVNARDKASPAAVTPMDQGNNRSDLDTTQAIRKAVMADDSLSTNAKNVKIVTENGVVTLRGPVKTEAEKKAIGAKATAAAGNNRVDNMLDVETTK